jgi:release factor glutamine methyltransferase
MNNAMNEIPDNLIKSWKRAQGILKDGGIEQPAIDARLLIEHAFGVTRTEIVSDPYRSISETQWLDLEAALRRRLDREPVARIVGRKGFWTLDLDLSPHVLVPRPETECIVDMVLKATDEAEAHSICDMGVGSGAIILSILSHRPHFRAVATDISRPALAMAKANADKYGLLSRLELIETSWGRGLKDNRFDIIVSNPPYIATDVIGGLSPEVKDHDPHLALDGGLDGLDAYRALLPEAYRLLKPKGRLWLEIGHDQAKAVEDLAIAAGFEGVETYRDLSNNPRIIIGNKPEL